MEISSSAPCNKPRTRPPSGSETSAPVMAPHLKQPRNLGKNDLGGVIFGCTNDTMSECLTRQLFGLPARHIVYVKNITPGLPLFLFNYSDRKLHGIYEAASIGDSYNPYAWTDGSEKTRYPAQVQIRVRLQCQALTESQFKPIIADNYYTQNHFLFELDHAQASKLMSKLSSMAVGPRPLIPRNPPQWTPVNRIFSSDNGRQQSGATQPLSSTGDSALSHDSSQTSGFQDESLTPGRNDQAVEPSLSNHMVEPSEKDLILKKLRELSLKRQNGLTNMVGQNGKDASEDVTDSVENTHENKEMALEESCDDSSFNPEDVPPTTEQLFRENQDLKGINQDQARTIEIQARMIEILEKQLAVLQNSSKTVESTSTPSGSLADAESPDEFQLNIDESIFIMGGFDGVSWLPALHSFSPSHDALISLKPMSFVRSYASVARLNGQLYVFGGGSGSILYNEVESYNVVNNEWTLCPPLNVKRGNSAGAGLKGKVFAVGGGDGAECFADLEMLDLDVGRWICGRSMMLKRFALAATELNGVLYAVGGYDGNDYLKSAERFDPREHSWSRIGSMESKRGSHSLVVKDEKIYALGGFDGTNMLPTVEIYDPRMDTWMAGSPLNQARGYLSAAALGESIYAIGGLKGNNDLLDSIECYKDGEGWQATSLKGVGKRCFASAIVLGQS